MEFPKTVEELLRAVCYRRVDIENLFDSESNSWIQFDPELGYIPSDTRMRDGIDEAWTTYTHGVFGERQLIAHASQPCRINTYGDSFTQCQQVSDGETWQERLAAHIGEPVRNFGSGGYSTYVAWKRALRMEDTDAAAEHIILNCFVDDHIRNLDAARWIRTAWNDRNRPANIAYPVHGLPWAHLRYDLDEKKFKHQDGICQKPKDLLALSDPDTFIETFRNDAIARLFVLELGGDVEVEDLEALADAFDIDVNLRDPSVRREDAKKLHITYGIRSTIHIVREIDRWCEQNSRRLLIATSYCSGTLSEGLKGNQRHDEEFITFLKEREFPWLDAIEMHRKDFATSSLSVDDYVASHYIQAKGAAVFGHYSPMANMLYAMGIKDEVAEWLEPSPPAYRS